MFENRRKKEERYDIKLCLYLSPINLDKDSIFQAQFIR